MDNHTTEDRTNHNVVTEEHTRENGVTNGTVNGIDDVGTKFLEVDLNGKLLTFLWHNTRGLELEAFVWGFMGKDWIGLSLTSMDVIFL